MRRFVAPAARLSARTALPAARPHAFVTSCMRASFATSASSSSSLSSSHELATSTAAHTVTVQDLSPSPVPTNLRTVKHELLKLLDEDASELAAAPDDGLVQFIKDGKMKIFLDKDGEIKLHRLVGDYHIVVTFASEADQDDMEGMGGADAPAAAANEGETTVEGQEQEGEEEGKYDLPAHSFEVDLINSKASKNSTIRISAQASKQGEFVIDSVTFDPITVPAAPGTMTPDSMLGNFNPETDLNRLDVADLSEDGQEKLLEMLEGLGVDDKLAQFVQHYSQVVRTQQYLDKIRRFKAFLNQ